MEPTWNTPNTEHDEPILQKFLMETAEAIEVVAHMESLLPRRPKERIDIALAALMQLFTDSLVT